jgi:hypothetical protein
MKKYRAINFSLFVLVLAMIVSNHTIYRIKMTRFWGVDDTVYSVVLVNVGSETGAGVGVETAVSVGVVTGAASVEAAGAGEVVSIAEVEVAIKVESGVEVEVEVTGVT